MPNGKAITPQREREYQPKTETALVRAEAPPPVETAAMVLAAQAEATVKARAYLAITRPRDLDRVREAFLRECSRPSFASEAIYNKPIGGSSDDDEGGGERKKKGIEGPSIRFAEAAAQAMTNVESGAVAIYDDETKRTMRVTVSDIERNVTYWKDVTFRKVVERKFLRAGEVPISSRTNSYGKTVHLRRATDDEMLNTENALVSKALRTLLLRVIPGWLVAEGEARVREVLAKQIKDDPDAQRHRLFDAFLSVGIPSEKVKDLLGHDAATLTEKEHRDLLGIYNAIKAGEITWQEVVEARLAEAEAAEAKKPEPAKPTKETKGAAGLRERVAAAAPAAAAPPPPAAPPPAKKPERESPVDRLRRMAAEAAARGVDGGEQPPPEKPRPEDDPEPEPPQDEGEQEPGSNG